MKMNSRSLHLKNINFEGFSTSNQWVGYFEKKGAYDFALIEDAITIISNFFSEQWKNFFALSALSYDDETKPHEKMPKNYNHIYSKAKHKKYLKEGDDNFGDYLYGDAPLPASSLSIHFDYNDFLDMSRIVMGHGGVIGEGLFLINLELGLVLYPHEDIGFGVISLSKDTSLCLKFLRDCYRYNEKFNIVID